MSELEEAIDQLSNIDVRLESILKKAEDGVKREDSIFIRNPVEDFEDICEMYENFSENFPDGYHTENQAEIEIVEFDFSSLGRGSHSASKILGIQEVGPYLKEAGSKLEQLYRRHGHEEEAERVGELNEKLQSLKPRS